MGCLMSRIDDSSLFLLYTVVCVCGVYVCVVCMCVWCVCVCGVYVCLYREWTAKVLTIRWLRLPVIPPSADMSSSNL